MDHQSRSHTTLSPLTTLASPTSYIYPTTSIPSTPTLLSRPSSTTRLYFYSKSPRSSAPSKSSTTISISGRPKRSYPSHHHADHENDEWLIRTASTLTLNRLEEKGQSWLVARHSSTSLNNDDDQINGSGVARHDPSHSKSMPTSARGSRQRLQLESPISRKSNIGGDSMMDELGADKEAIGPDFVNVEEYDEEEEDIPEEIDEGEMKKVVRRRVGGWLDWAVGWLDLGNYEEDEDNLDNRRKQDSGAEEAKKGDLDPVDLRERLRKKNRRDEEVESGIGNVPTPPEGERAGTWSDAMWLLTVAKAAALE